MSRTNKKPYPKKAQQTSKRCRCHGGCSYCLGNRMHHVIKQLRQLDNA